MYLSETQKNLVLLLPLLHLPCKSADPLLERKYLLIVQQTCEIQAVSCEIQAIVGIQILSKGDGEQIKSV